MIVLDASAAVEFLLATPLGQRVDALLTELGGTLHAPHVVDVEVLTAIRRMAATGDVSAGDAEAALRDLGDLPLQRYEHQALLERAWALRSSISAADAMYVALAEGLDATLITCDGRLARAHGHEAEIELVDGPR